MLQSLNKKYEIKGNKRGKTKAIRNSRKNKSNIRKNM